MIDIVILHDKFYGGYFKQCEYPRVECDYPLIFCPLCGEELRVYSRIIKGYTFCTDCGADITHG